MKRRNVLKGLGAGTLLCTGVQPTVASATQSSTTTESQTSESEFTFSRDNGLTITYNGSDSWDADKLFIGIQNPDGNRGFLWSDLSDTKTVTKGASVTIKSEMTVHQHSYTFDLDKAIVDVMYEETHGTATEILGTWTGPDAPEDGRVAESTATSSESSTEPPETQTSNSNFTFSRDGDLTITYNGDDTRDAQKLFIGIRNPTGNWGFLWSDLSEQDTLTSGDSVVIKSEMTVYTKSYTFNLDKAIVDVVYEETHGTATETLAKWAGPDAPTNGWSNAAPNESPEPFTPSEVQTRPATELPSKDTSQASDQGRERTSTPTSTPEPTPTSTPDSTPTPTPTSASTSSRGREFLSGIGSTVDSSIDAVTDSLGGLF